MARKIAYTLTDDLADGAKLQPNQAVRVTVTDRDEVWIVDTARRNVTVALLKSAGLKQAKRGRKSADATTDATETDAPDAPESPETDAPESSD
jgi:hypothetical protein